MFAVDRDASHKIRICTQNPLLAADVFKEWWDDVFGGEHALIPDIKNSAEWTEQLLLCQRHILRHTGAQGGGMEVVAKVMSFAKQRFEACGSPQRNYCCLLVAMALLLAWQACDKRNDLAVRKRAERRLEQMPDQVCTAGLSATYSTECIIFLRLFDVNDHDPALTYRQRQAFQTTCASCLSMVMSGSHLRGPT